MFGRLVVVVLIVGVVGSGCAFGKMETARQLEQGELVTSGSLDWPGALFLPRVAGNAMYGVGGHGDVSAHAGTTIITANAGIGGRVYLGERFTASVQADGIYNFDPVESDFLTGGDQIGRAIIAVTPRITTAVRDDELFYAGIHGHYLGMINRPAEGGLDYSQGRMPVGFLVGVDHLFAGGNWGFQAELSAMPVAIDFEEGPIFFDSPPYFYPQLGVGMYYRWN